MVARKSCALDKAHKTINMDNTVSILRTKVPFARCGVFRQPLMSTQALTCRNVGYYSANGGAVQGGAAAGARAAALRLVKSAHRRAPPRTRVNGPFGCGSVSARRREVS